MFAAGAQWPAVQGSVIPAICPKIKFIIPAVGRTVINRERSRQFDSLISMRRLLSLSQIGINCFTKYRFLLIAYSGQSFCR